MVTLDAFTILTTLGLLLGLLAGFVLFYMIPRK